MVVPKSCRSRAKCGEKLKSGKQTRCDGATARREAETRNKMEIVTSKRAVTSCFGDQVMSNEADTCRQFVVPGLQAAGWDTDPHSIAEQRSFTDGCIIANAGGACRRPGKRADYLLHVRFRSGRGRGRGRVPQVGRRTSGCRRALRR